MTDPTGRRPHLLIVVSQSSHFEYVRPVAAAALERGFHVSVRAGAVPSSAARDGRSDSGSEDAFDVRVVHLDRSRRGRFRYLLRAVGALVVYASQDELSSRYFRRAIRPFIERRVTVRMLRFLALGRLSRHWPMPVMTVLRAVHTALGPAPAAADDIAALQPSIVLTAGVNKAWRLDDDPVPDYLDAAHRASIPSVGLVLSWDNLTTKGTFLPRPQRLMAWNSFHIGDAIRRHGFDRSEVIEVGIPRYDSLDLSMRRRAASEAPRARGSHGARTILYLGSSWSIAPDEARLVMGIRAALDARGLDDWRLRVRPHPANPRSLLGVSQPRIDVEDPASARSGRAGDPSEFMTATSDILCFVGINTSGFIDAALTGVPGFCFWREDIDGGEHPSRHLRAFIRAGVVRPVDGIEAFVDAAVRLDRLALEPSAVEVGPVRDSLGLSDRPSSQRVLDVLVEMLGPGSVVRS